MWLGPLLIALTLFGISRLFGAQPLAAIYREKFPETPRERLFWSSLGFFVAVAVVRTLTFLIHNQIGPFHDIEMSGRHIHHRSEEHTSELQSPCNLVCRLLLEKNKMIVRHYHLHQDKQDPAILVTAQRAS